MGENLFSPHQTYFPSEKERDHLSIHPSVRLTALTRNYSLHSFLCLILMLTVGTSKQNVLSFFIITPASLFDFLSLL